ncbi:hypothetical protein GCM10010313_20610 [Streptomyces violarus]|uniref:Excisionase family DNA binding protein n=1 Tax=Streptomyces violarus TaxID=67380 RepID=A0A7W5F0K3_9ACTN|nr:MULTISPECIES: helix-turn-helix domain-containing protein [Streptomyces]MBB3075585.1 excisionase family DNA binding protein [Streptomyces violarus]WRT98175.1 helix-turn-helix domain-containing protein [Streptomyces sp. CGMCC 4.1772]GHD04383.1 hypothetical protein GCM10010313_20610 [Streptomyces violarus]
MATKEQATNNEFMSPKELAELLGLPLSSVYGFNAEGTAPRRVRLGRHIRYRRADVEAWLDRHVVDGGAK